MDAAASNSIAYTDCWPTTPTTSVEASFPTGSGFRRVASASATASLRPNLGSRRGVHELTATKRCPTGTEGKVKRFFPEITDEGP